MTDLKTTLQTLEAKCAFIATARKSKTAATGEVDAATDAAILAAIAVGDACNGVLPDKRALQTQYPDAVKWKEIPSNLLTYARLIMQGEGETVTIGRGDKAEDYTVERATLAQTPFRLSTVATNLRDLFKVKEAQEAIHAELSRVTAVQVIAESPVMAERYSDVKRWKRPWIWLPFRKKRASRMTRNCLRRGARPIRTRKAIGWKRNANRRNVTPHKPLSTP